MALFGFFFFFFCETYRKALTFDIVYNCTVLLILDASLK